MRTYLGYRSADEQVPWAKFFNNSMLPIQVQAAEGLKQSPMPAESLPDFDSIYDLQHAGYQRIENGFSLQKDGSLRVAILTDMPDVTPPMWDWWFGWHGSDATRYKLWHPQAHLHAEWQDGRNDVAYVGRNSLIEEYIGKSLEKAAIQFVDPQSIGLPANTATQVHICARLGYRDYPINFGWLVHQVRSTPNGAEMRSRFWMGAQHIQARGSGWLLRKMVAALRTVIRLTKQRGIDLLTHCAEEMQHLSRILPEIYRTFS
jgi:DAPG hydrolase PhiG domain